MTERTKLIDWIDSQGIANDTLADAVGFVPSNVSMIVSGYRDISDAFKWRFACAYGWNTATQIFSTEIKRKERESV